jgi:hypothetical protein
MKKILGLVLILALAVSANAAAFKWGMAADRVQLPTGTFITDGSAMGYLVYLGNDGSADYDILGYVVNNPDVDSKESSSTGLAATRGRIVGTFDQAMGTELGGSGDMFETGSVFGMYVLKDGWINIAGNTYTVAGLADDGSVLSDAVFTFDWSQNAAGAPATAGGGWAIVPEPGTAALALAGIALLIRRRK